MSIRIIGDVHGLVSEGRADGFTLAKEAKGRTYLSIASEAGYSIQLGDVGWRENLIDVRNNTLSDDNHKVILGNHDDYDNPISKSLGDYGLYELNGIQFAFVRGEYSVDKAYRAHVGPNKSWWEQEELTTKQGDECIQFFENTKFLSSPPVGLMLSHGCPHFLLPQIVTNKWKLNPSYTSQLLSAVYELVKPKLWIFGHHHQNIVLTHEDTTFVCLNELCWIDLSVEDGNFVLRGDINLKVKL